MYKAKQILAALVLSLLTAFAHTLPVIAAEANSNNYGVSEVNFGSGGELRACSTAYCSKQSAGELTVGNTKGTEFQAETGFNTNREPTLEVISTNNAIDLGILDENTTKFGAMNFSVKTYLASGYIVMIDGEGPTNGRNGYELTNMSTLAASIPGTEQFGINLRDNDVPNIGADPIGNPGSFYSTGDGINGYGVKNQFKFNSGGTIAQSLSSTDYRNYTLSAIANVNTTTPGGKYTARLSLIVVPTF